MGSATSGSVPMNTYIVDILVPFGKTGWAARSVLVMEFAAPLKGPYQLLLGRDVICQGVLTLSFDGHFSLAL